MPEESSVMAQPEHPGSQPGPAREKPPSRSVWYRALAAARGRGLAASEREPAMTSSTATRLSAPKRTSPLPSA